MRLLRLIWASLVLSALSAVTVAHAQDGSGARVALVIGNTNYPDSDAPLSTVAEDARAFGRELQRRGYVVDQVEDLSKRTMKEAAERFLERLQPGHTAVLYFGGYGIQANRQNYLIPVDAQIWTEPDVVRDGLSVEFIVGELTRRGVRASYIILDAAHRNPFERRFRSYSTGLLPIVAPPPHAAIIYSSAGGAVLRQAPGPRSVFGTELVKQIQTADGLVPQVLERTRAGVVDLTRNEQVPWISLPATAAPPVAALPPAAAPETAPRPAPPRPAPPAPAPSQPAPAPRPAQAEAAADPGADFRAAQQAATKQAYEDFIAKHKSGPYVDMARAELDRLNAPPPAPKVAQAPPPPPRPVKPYSREEEKLLAELSDKISRNPNDAAALTRRGQIYGLHEDLPRALADFDRLVQLNPRDVEALNNRCWVRAVLDELDSALVDCNEALKLRPTFVDALDSRGFINLKIGLPRLAVADYDAALKGNARLASALYGRGLARVRLGEAKEGNGDMARALAINPAVADDFARFGVR